MRTKGSCRFEPYYKVEWYNHTAFCWHVIQKAYPSEQKARDAMPKDKTCRLQKVTETERTIIK
jgi:hypothetical protein